MKNAQLQFEATQNTLFKTKCKFFNDWRHSAAHGVNTHPHKGHRHSSVRLRASATLKHAAVREEEALFTHLNSKHFIQTNTSVSTSDPKRFAHFLPFTEISHPHWLLLQHEATGLSHCVSTSTQARSQGNV